MEFALIILALLAVWIFIDNRRLTSSRYRIKSNRLPDSFSGFKIVQVSDLHGASFGRENSRLLSRISAERPDIIVITGDLINSRETDIAAAERFCRAAGEIAPVFFSSGNHESRLENYSSLREKLQSSGVTVLENESVKFEKNGETIVISGIQDPRFVTDYNYDNSLAAVRLALEKMSLKKEDFNLLLSHRPELMAAYKEQKIDLVFSGHAHGGQFRLPPFGGLFVPNQGFFPRYDAGLFGEDKTQMIVSRGLGRSIIPFRIFNPPDLVIAELTKQDC